MGFYFIECFSVDAFRPVFEEPVIAVYAVSDLLFEVDRGGEVAGDCFLAGFGIQLSRISAGIIFHTYEDTQEDIFVNQGNA